MVKTIPIEQRNNKGNKRGLHPNSLKNLEKGRQWRKEQSGNPKGRPPLAITSLIREMLDEQADYIAPGAAPSDKTWRQLIAKAILYHAAKGNPVMIRELLERLEGKITQPVVGEGGGPVVIKVVYDNGNKI